MRTILKLGFFIFSGILVFYLLLPNPSFPEPPPDALQSNEPADTETTLRRAYFTNFTREEVLVHYKNQLQKSAFLGVPLPTYRLNYPPEEAKTIIRDQTRSTFLEEIVHPLRESVFINGFEPKDAKDTIFINDKYWRQKIIVRFIPSSVVIRISVILVSLILATILFRNWMDSIKKLFYRG